VKLQVFRIDSGRRNSLNMLKGKEGCELFSARGKPKNMGGGGQGGQERGEKSGLWGGKKKTSGHVALGGCKKKISRRRLTPDGKRKREQLGKGGGRQRCSYAFTVKEREQKKNCLSGGIPSSRAQKENAWEMLKEGTITPDAIGGRKSLLETGALTNGKRKATVPPSTGNFCGCMEEKNKACLGGGWVGRSLVGEAVSYFGKRAEKTAVFRQGVHKQRCGLLADVAES